MATTTATITLASADMMDNAISISNTATLYTAGTETGLTETTGLARKKFASSSKVDLLTHGSGVAADVTADKAAKVFIHNANARNASKHVVILINSVEVGTLYGGDWMFFPWSGGSGKDIEIDPSDATETLIEYMVFFE
tara:strand:+ start:741 stop:1157 length:417 start_codon:yes stop_codon:yes gene_type:complete